MNTDTAIRRFNQSLATALNSGEVFKALHLLTDTLVATVNMLDVEHHYTQERVTIVEQGLLRPSMAAVLFDKC